MPNYGIELAYYRKLHELIKKMVQEVSSSVLLYYRKGKSEISFAQDDLAQNESLFLERMLEKYGKLFEEDGKKIAETFLAEQLKYVNISVQFALKRVLPKKEPIASKALEKIRREPTFIEFAPIFLTQETKNTMNAAIAENVSLIKSIPSQYMNQIVGSVMRSIQANGSIEDLVEDLKKYSGMTTRRARLIVEDQTRKVHTALTLRKFQESGIKYFQWLHMGGSARPRPYHLAKYPNGLNFGVFSIEHPPVIDTKTGERGFPGQLPNCKCTMAAVIDM